MVIFSFHRDVQTASIPFKVYKNYCNSIKMLVNGDI